jgi:hypothetical protein
MTVLLFLFRLILPGAFRRPGARRGAVPRLPKWWGRHPRSVVMPGSRFRNAFKQTTGTGWGKKTNHARRRSTALPGKRSSTSRPSPRGQNALKIFAHCAPEPGCLRQVGQASSLSPGTDRLEACSTLGNPGRAVQDPHGFSSRPKAVTCPARYTRLVGAYRRFPNRLYRRFPNRLACPWVGRVRLAVGLRVGKPAIPQTWKSAVRKNRLVRAVGCENQEMPVRCRIGRRNPK